MKGLLLQHTNNDRQSAIVRGAALSGLIEVQPTSRKSRMHYGWAAGQHWDPVRHQVRDYYESAWDGSPHARGNMLWELAKVIIREGSF